MSTVRSYLAGATLLLSLSACASSPAAPNGGLIPQGLVEITFSSIGSGGVRATAEGVTALHAQGLTDTQGGLQLQPAGAGTLVVGQTRYLYASFRVRNAAMTGAAYLTPSANFAFFAVGAAGAVAGTAVSALKRLDGSEYRDAPTLRKTIARSILPAHAMSLQNGAPTLLPGAADFTALSEDEVNPAKFTPPTTLASMGLNTIFPYAFMVRCVNNCALGPRTLAPDPAPGQYDGEVTFAVKLPMQLRASDDPVSLSLLFEALGDAPTRVTLSPEEGLDLFAASQRALDTGADSVLAIGSGQFTLSASEDAALRVRSDYHALTYQGLANVRTADPDPRPAPGDLASFSQPATLLPNPQQAPSFVLPPTP